MLGILILRYLLKKGGLDLSLKHIIPAAVGALALVVSAVVVGAAQVPGLGFTQMAAHIEEHHGNLVGLELVRSNGSAVYRAGVEVDGVTYTVFFNSDNGVEIFRYQNGGQWQSSSAPAPQAAPVAPAAPAQTQAPNPSWSPSPSVSPRPTGSPSSSSSPRPSGSPRPTSSPRRS